MPNRTADRARVAKFRAANLCICGQPLAPDSGYYCMRHRDKQRARRGVKGAWKQGGKGRPPKVPKVPQVQAK